MDKDNIKRGVYLPDIFIACFSEYIKILAGYLFFSAMQGIMEFLGYAKEPFVAFYHIPSGVHG